MIHKPIPIDLLPRVLRLDRDAGRLYWKKREPDLFDSGSRCRRWNLRWAGLEAGTYLSSGYIGICILYERFMAHRLVWAMLTGREPAGEIDHINGVRDDNRPDNLRDVTSSENRRNAAMPRSNTSGVTGVNWQESRGKWRAYITDGDRTTHLGRFDSFDDAVAARLAEQKRRGFHANHGRQSC